MNKKPTIKSIKEFKDLAHALYECPSKNGFWDAIDFGEQAIKDLLKAERQEMIELVKKRISDEITYQVKIGSKQASYKISVLYKIIKTLNK